MSARPFRRLVTAVKFGGDLWRGTWVIFDKYRVRFAVGDGVTWNERRRGGLVSRLGLIREVVEPETKPVILPGFLIARDHISYVVFTGQKLCWPAAHILEPVETETTMTTRKRIFTKDQILILRDEVHQTAVEKGWWASAGVLPLTGDDICEKLFLVISELSEAFEVYRSRRDLNEIWEGPEGKPEGFGIEMGDAYIRILDLSGAMGVSDLYADSDLYGDEEGDGKPLPTLMMEATICLSRACLNLGQTELVFLARSFALFLGRVEAICARNGVDLAKAIEAKAAYNKTRPYRHGNKKA